MSKLTAVHEMVDRYLHRMGLQPGADGVSIFRRGTTAVTLSLLEDGGHVYVRVVAAMLTDTIEPTFQVLRAINHLNSRVHYGAFILFDDHKLCFAATILGDRLDFEELEEALQYVSEVGDRYDEALQRLVGGLRAEDVLEDARDIE